MSVTLHPNNPHVFVCREGHVSREAYGETNLTCKKIIAVEEGERPCKLKVLALEKEFAHALHRRGWEKRGQNVAVILTRIFDEIAANAPEA
jgi:hypothetical protein